MEGLGQTGQGSKNPLDQKETAPAHFFFTSSLHKRTCLRAETPLRRAGMGKPLFKASDGD
jgi:hypothetical protein